ncbi:hypothetical protein F4861DRAFT_548360 [Xylaria intraflava]|nr:hypothetical protein F4861DRAFT_548360 [Xylaria intraflava]
MSTNNTCERPQSTPGRAAGSVNQRPRPPPNRRRDKPQLSCNLCRRRKSRCDRQHPCSTCKKRGLDSSCTYATTNAPSASSSGIEDRLKYLEHLVFSHVNQNEGVNISIAAQTPLSIQEPDTSPALSDGVLKSSSTETKYQDSTHWNTILDAIAELKENLGEADDPKPTRIAPDLPPNNSTDFPLLYGCRHCNKDEILAAVPPKNDTDCLVSECFEFLEFSSCAINKGEFLTQYALLWETPQDVPIMWLGLLFSILSVAINIREFDSEQPESSPQVDYGLIGAGYREKTVQCLILGQYTRCGPYVIETLLLHYAAEFARRREANNEAWLILSTTIHLAMRMGYHRDPGHFKSISPYEGELRRRLWAMLYHLGESPYTHIATSGQLGVPRLINDANVDTAEPRNLFDSDFNPSSKELPPSRPDNEPTPMLIILSKFRTGLMYSAVVDIVTNPQPPTYAQVLQTDRRIEEMFLQVPEYCRIKSLLESMSDLPQILLQRIFIQMNYHRAQIILHWRYLTLARKENRYSYSTKKTVSAALKILELYQVVYEGLKTGGGLYAVKWRLTSFINHDYILATSILCFYLRKNGDSISADELSEIKHTLRQTKMVTTHRLPMSPETRRAAAAIESALPGIFEDSSNESSSGSPNESRAWTPIQGFEPHPPASNQDPFAGPMLPLFNPMFERAPMFPSHISDMGNFIDSVLGGSIDPWLEIM